MRRVRLFLPADRRSGGFFSCIRAHTSAPRGGDDPSWTTAVDALTFLRPQSGFRTQRRPRTASLENTETTHAHRHAAATPCRVDFSRQSRAPNRHDLARCLSRAASISRPAHDTLDLVRPMKTCIDGRSSIGSTKAPMHEAARAGSSTKPLLQQLTARGNGSCIAAYLELDRMRKSFVRRRNLPL